MSLALYHMTNIPEVGVHLHNVASFTCSKRREGGREGGRQEGGGGGGGGE